MIHDRPSEEGDIKPVHSVTRPEETAQASTSMAAADPTQHTPFLAQTACKHSEPDTHRPPVGIRFDVTGRRAVRDADGETVCSCVADCDSKGVTLAVCVCVKATVCKRVCGTDCDWKGVILAVCVCIEVSVRLRDCVREEVFAWLAVCEKVAGCVWLCVLLAVGVAELVVLDVGVREQDIKVVAAAAQQVHTPEHAMVVSPVVEP